jgi:hypothetical protein
VEKWAGEEEEKEEEEEEEAVETRSGRIGFEKEGSDGVFMGAWIWFFCCVT